MTEVLFMLAAKAQHAAMTTKTQAHRIALITGGNRGIGRNTALRLADDGVDIIITYRRHAEEAEGVRDELSALGRRAVALELDLAQTGSFDRFAEIVRAVLRDTWGRERFQILVNNGGMSRGGLIANVVEGDIDDLFAVHVKGTLFLTQRLLPLLADGGTIVNLSSAVARVPVPHRAAYGAMKGAVEVLTRYMAVELGARGITANVIAPGAVATDFSGGALRDSPGMQEHLASQTPLGRHAVAEDIGPVIANLVRPGNGWVTGQRIEVAGGMSL
jgi:NAD(P)-dependent dehydrogenase (short-subunit alcohol dehydrogenase family)